MESHEVIRNALAKSHVKEVADKMGLSLSLVYKWGEGGDAKGSGTANPLERVKDLYQSTQDDHLIQWLCNKADGYFVKNPPTNRRPGREVMPATQEIIQQFADLLSAISRAASDNSISAEESKHIRHEWDELKRYTERFVKWCEMGDFVHLAENLKVNRSSGSKD
jgi:transposase